MTRDEIIAQILQFFRKEFEIENPGLDDNLREKYGFDSIDAIELLLKIENLLGSELTQEEKKQAMAKRLRQLLSRLQRRRESLCSPRLHRR
jgi:acyl carrier protein